MTAPHAVPITGPDALQEIMLRRGILEEYSLIVHNNGVLTRNGRDMVSASHTPADNDRAVEAFTALLDCLA